MGARSGRGPGLGLAAAAAVHALERHDIVDNSGKLIGVLLVVLLVIGPGGRGAEAVARVVR